MVKILRCIIFVIHSSFSGMTNTHKQAYYITVYRFIFVLLYSVSSCEKTLKRKPQDILLLLATKFQVIFFGRVVFSCNLALGTKNCLLIVVIVVVFLPFTSLAQLPVAVLQVQLYQECCHSNNEFFRLSCSLKQQLRQVITLSCTNKLVLAVQLGEQFI